ncbi:agamous-like MADS-box protein AGL62 [Impatiens glandulifera]|uniref:agamous-like MADS-box protein AGL62 n=1 Tax=Impatiens glandulifera TaxID=253017 RepID=UPI001FB133E2|nr:agamous-like MADS-box protein AGL62 [Impatiens glandulifera]
MTKRTSKGRQKITMAKMQNESNLQVTFSKRRIGLFKKSSELTTLCGAEMLLIVFSPAEKVFSFGHPNVDEIANRFLNIHDSSSSTKLSNETQVTQLKVAQPVSHISELNARIMEVQELLKIEKQRGEVVAQALKAGREQNWWQRSIEEMNYQQLELFKGSLTNVKNIVDQKMYEASKSLHLGATTSLNNGGESSSNGSNASAKATGFNFKL